MLIKFQLVCSVGLHTVTELGDMQKRMMDSDFTTYNLTESDLVKDHLRYLVSILFLAHLISRPCIRGIG